MNFPKRQQTSDPWRFVLIKIFGWSALLIVICRLGFLAIYQGEYYQAIAASQHAVSEELVPERGSIYSLDYGDEIEYALATEAPSATLYAVPTEINSRDPKNGEVTALSLATVLKLGGYEEYLWAKELALLRALETEQNANTINNIEPSKANALASLGAVEHGWEEGVIKNPATTELVNRLKKTSDPYEPVADQLSLVEIKQIESLNLDGIYLIKTRERIYPEIGWGGQVLGFVSNQDKINTYGQYGLEGYFDQFLRGEGGLLSGDADREGRLLALGIADFKPAINGGDLVVTIDRRLQLKVCEIVSAAKIRYEAKAVSVIILNPFNGEILSLCSVPNFDSENYGAIQEINHYNNPVIFDSYEPGSVIKPLVMAGAIDLGVITPESTFVDPGVVTFDEFTITNANDKEFGKVNMTQVLEDSINTGMIWVMRQMGPENLKKYLTNFGFGRKSGIELSTEVGGSLEQLDNPAEIYAATAAFGQGISTTMLQLALGYAALANGGELIKPQIIKEYRYSDGTTETSKRTVVRRVINESTAKLVGAMLVSVVDNGHGKRAGVPGYYIAGKTGTAQIAERGAYSESNFNGTFAGYGPITSPKFVMVVRVDSPAVGALYAEASAAPVFSEIARFLLSYYGIAPDRPQE